jgi:2-C-methyl-D-erythritol 2,4-cyclodiphosphate synthase
MKSFPRIGHGIDVHRFGPGDHIVLGGVRIPHEQGLVAHSDGDVAIHALCDALLGALALGDIGKHFPDDSASYAGIDSRILLRKVITLLEDRAYLVANVDITILAERPKLAPYIDAMRAVLAEDLRCAVDAVSVKATTTEKLGFVGRKEGIEAHAVVMLFPQAH